MTRWIWRLCGSLWYNCNITQVWWKEMGLLTTTQTLQSTQMGAVNMFCLTIHQNRYSWQNTLLWYELIINDILCYYGIFVLRLTTSGMVYKKFGFSWEKDLNLSSRIVNTWPRNSVKHNIYLLSASSSAQMSSGRYSIQNHRYAFTMTSSQTIWLRKIWKLCVLPRNYATSTVY